MDAWEPLIRIADSLGDDDWLYWAWGQILEANDALADGRQWELERSIFGAVIAGFMENAGMLLVKEPLPLSTVTKCVKQDFPWIAPKTVGNELRKLGFRDIHNKGGTFHIFTTLDEIRAIAKDIGFKDDTL